MSADEPLTTTLASAWPPFGLRIRSERLLLRLPTDADITALIDVARAGIHPPDEMPFLVPWTDDLEEEISRTTLGGVRTLWYESVASHLTPDRLAAIVPPGELKAVEPPIRMAHARRPLSRYRLAESGAEKAQATGLAALAQAMSAWPGASGSRGSPAGGGNETA